MPASAPLVTCLYDSMNYMLSDEELLAVFARVREALRKAGYHPNTSARSLRTGRTDMIALIISDIANPSFGLMASAMEKYACESGLGVVFYNTHDDPGRELQQVAAARQLRAHQPEGGRKLDVTAAVDGCQHHVLLQQRAGDRFLFVISGDYQDEAQRALVDILP